METPCRYRRGVAPWPFPPHDPVALEQVATWQDDLAALQDRIAPRFVRPEVSARAGRYLAGLLAPLERRNGWAQGLLIRRSPSDLQDLTCYRAYGPDASTITDLAQVTGTRWTIEEGCQQAKAIGLDEYEVRTWQGWHRHITLCLLAHAFLAFTRAAAEWAQGGMPAT